MDNNAQLPVEVVEEIEKQAEAHNDRLKELAESEKDIAYAQGFAEGWHEGATAYAAKLQEVQRENDSLTNQLKTHSNVSNENIKLLRQENEKLRVDRNEAKKLLAEVFRKHECGLLPDRFIYEKIKTFLYGE